MVVSLSRTRTRTHAHTHARIHSHPKQPIMVDVNFAYSPGLSALRSAAGEAGRQQISAGSVWFQARLYDQVEARFLVCVGGGGGGLRGGSAGVVSPLDSLSLPRFQSPALLLLPRPTLMM